MQNVEQVVTETVTYLSKKYGFAEEEAQSEVKQNVLSKYQEKKIGRPEKQKKEHASSPREKEEEEASTFLAEVDRLGESKVEYKKISKKGKTKIDTPVNNVSVVQAQSIAEVEEDKSSSVAVAVVDVDVDAKIAEVMRAQAEKFKEMMMTKKDAAPKVTKVSKKVLSKVLPKVEEPKTEVPNVLPEVLPKVEEVASSSSDVDAKIAEVMRAQAEKFKSMMQSPKVAAVSVVEEKPKLLKKKPASKVVVAESAVVEVVDMSLVNKKIAEVMQAQASKMLANVPVVSPLVTPVAQVEKKKKKSTKVTEVSVVTEVKEVVVHHQVVEQVEVIEDADLLKLMDEYEKSREVVEIPVEQMITLPIAGEESMTMFRHEGTIYKKSKSGLLYDKHISGVCLGKVEENGKVTLMAQRVEDELCSEEESGSEDEVEYDSEEE